MSDVQWIFERPRRMGGASGEAFTNTLQATGMSAASVLVREAIQNSADASTGDKVRIVFRRVSLVGSQKAEFAELLRLQTALRPRSDVIQLTEDNCLTHLDDGNRPLELLFIEDYGTHGLIGDPHDSDSHFYRLLLALGDSQKAQEDADLGGSYGYGKSVYSSNSGIQTFVAYSAFDPASDPFGASSRLLGCCYFVNHRFQGEKFTGRGWLGLPVGGHADEADPLADDAADAMAGALGFRLRSRQEPGTSLLIVDCDVTPEEIASAVETWWWPRLVDRQLDVEIEGPGGRMVPRPRKDRPDLAPYIECYEVATGRTPTARAGMVKNDLYKLEGVPLGTYVFALIGADQARNHDAQEHESPQDQAPLNAVALIRSPKMIVEYMAISNLAVPCIGVFVADLAIDKALKISEPPAHDRWDQKTSRLSRFPPVWRTWVAAVSTRLPRQMRTFAERTAPPPPPGGNRLRQLERKLAHFLRPQGDGSTPPGGKQDPISLRLVQQPQRAEADGGAVTKGSVRVELADTAEVDAAEVELLVKNLVRQDRGNSTAEASPVVLSSREIELAQEDGRADAARFTIVRGQKPRIDYETKPYDPDWTTRIVVQARVITND